MVHIGTRSSMPPFLFLERNMPFLLSCAYYTCLTEVVRNFEQVWMMRRGFLEAHTTPFKNPTAVLSLHDITSPDGILCSPMLE